MHRFFVSSSGVDLNRKLASIEGEDVKHISRVLRLKEGNIVEICDGENHEYICEIKSIDKNYISLTILEQTESNREAPIHTILYQGIPKGSKMDLIIQKTVELGIAEIVPVEMDRTVVLLKDEKDKEKKVERWQKIALEASKQSKRGVVPTIHQPVSFDEALRASKQNDLNLMPYENEGKNGLKSILASFSIEARSKINKIGIWIGPEGGLEEEEVTKAKENQIHPITLGPRILRTETAGFTILALVMYELGDLGGA